MATSDLGVICYAQYSGDSGSFTQGGGQVGTVQTLTEANYIASAYTAQVGSADKLVIAIQGAISVAMASVTVIVEAQRLDLQNTGAAFNRWQVIGTVRSDSPSTAPAASQTITRANLVGQSVADGVGGGASTETIGVRLLTTDHAFSAVRVLLKAANAPQTGDVIIVAVNAGGWS